MPALEYLTVTRTVEKDEPSLPRLVEVLNSYGLQGWELINAKAHEGKPHVIDAYLKRPR
jgi:hypothetical protein